MQVKDQELSVAPEQVFRNPGDAIASETQDPELWESAEAVRVEADESVVLQADHFQTKTGPEAGVREKRDPILVEVNDQGLSKDGRNFGQA